MGMEIVGYVLGLWCEIISYVLIYRGIFGIPIRKLNGKEKMAGLVVGVLSASLYFLYYVNISIVDLLFRELFVFLCSVYMINEKNKVRILAYILAYMLYSIADDVSVVAVQKIFAAHVNIVATRSGIGIRLELNMIIFAFFAFIDHIAKNRLKNIYQLVKSKIYLIMVSALFTVTLLQTFVSYSVFDDANGAIIILRKMLVPTLLGGILVIVLCGLIVQMLKSEEIQKNLLLVLEQKNQQQEQYSRVVYEKAELLRKEHHDFHHHVNYLYQQMQGGNYGEVEAYLVQLREDDRYMNREYVQFSGNRVIDAVIYAMVQRCEGKNIEISCQGKLKSNIGIKDIDLCVVVSNILENAMEACQNVIGDKKIWIKVLNYQDAIVIEVKNPLDDTIQGKVLKTTKVDYEKHGFGTRIIQETAAKYGGEYQVMQQEGQFVSTVIMHELNEE